MASRCAAAAAAAVAAAVAAAAVADSPWGPKCVGRGKVCPGFQPSYACLPANNTHTFTVDCHVGTGFSNASSKSETEAIVIAAELTVM